MCCTVCVFVVVRVMSCVGYVLGYGVWHDGYVSWCVACVVCCVLHGVE